MPNARDITSGSSNILLVGDSGTWKTGFLGSCPKPYVFDFDAGMATNRGKDIDYDTFKDIPLTQALTQKAPTALETKLGFYKYGEAWFAFIKKLNEIGVMMDKGTCPYLTIGLDSLSFLSEIARNAALWQQDKKVLHQGTYGAETAYIKTVLSQLTAWPIRIVATAHINRDNNDLTQVIEKLPLLTGKLSGFISAFFDEVYFCEPHPTEKNGIWPKFIIKSQATPSMRQAKSRWGVPDGSPLNFADLVKYYGKLG